MGKLIDITGQRYGRLLVLKRFGRNASKQTLWLCRCDCGNEVSVTGSHLKNGDTRSCGCLHNEGNNTKHGGRKTRLYNIWAKMRRRCANENDEAYKDYGGRGITVCPEWQESFEAFRDWALANGYRDDLSIDRKDNDGNYCPENCRWATQKIQGNNQRSNRLCEYNGKTMTLKQWAEEAGINYKTLHTRMSRGWTLERALTTKIAENGGK